MEILRARRFDASAAGSVAEALAHLGRAPVDVVLSDLRMPGADGLDLVRRIQTTAPEVPVVILTGHGNVASAVECLKAGASDYILKPAEPEALEVALERALEARALRREVKLPAQHRGRPDRDRGGRERGVEEDAGHGRGGRAHGLGRALHRGVGDGQGAARPPAARASPPAPPLRS